MRVLLASVIALVGCARTLPPIGQILLYVDTDAPLPPALGRPPGPNDPVPLFDTLVVDVIDPDGKTCSACTRTFALDTERVREGASFGIPARPGVAGYRARLRLYDSHSDLSGALPADLQDGTPPPSVIDVTASLPVVPDHGVIERTVLLETERIGTPTEVETVSGRPTSSRVGTWSGVTPTPCKGTVRPEEVCIPGGTFWMGNPRVRGTGKHDGADIRRLVTLSPFYMRRTEVTVPEFRAFSTFAGSWSGNSDGSSLYDFCTFTKLPGPHETMPMNCLSWAIAQKYCQAQGGDLPTEAQYEWVASRFRSDLYVWGGDESRPGCADVVLGRSGWGLFERNVAPCKPDVAPGGPLPVGSAVRDRLMLSPTDAVVDLVGNVAEWVRDRWNRQEESCWSKPGVYRDPSCDQPGVDGGAWRVARGGAWLGTPSDGAAAARRGTGYQSGDPTVGFRCTRDASR